MRAGVFVQAPVALLCASSSSFCSIKPYAASEKVFVSPVLVTYPCSSNPSLTVESFFSFPTWPKSVKPGCIERWLEMKIAFGCSNLAKVIVLGWAGRFVNGIAKLQTVYPSYNQFSWFS